MLTKRFLLTSWKRSRSTWEISLMKTNQQILWYIGRVSTVIWNIINLAYQAVAIYLIIWWSPHTAHVMVWRPLDKLYSICVTYGLLSLSILPLVFLSHGYSGMLIGWVHILANHTSLVDVIPTQRPQRPDLITETLWHIILCCAIYCTTYIFSNNNHLTSLKKSFY